MRLLSFSSPAMALRSVALAALLTGSGAFALAQDAAVPEPGPGLDVLIPASENGNSRASFMLVDYYGEVGDFERMGYHATLALKDGNQGASDALLRTFEMREGLSIYDPNVRLGVLSLRAYADAKKAGEERPAVPAERFAHAQTVLVRLRILPAPVLLEGEALTSTKEDQLRAAMTKLAQTPRLMTRLNKALDGIANGLDCNRETQMCRAKQAEPSEGEETDNSATQGPTVPAAPTAPAPAPAAPATPAPESPAPETSALPPVSPNDPAPIIAKPIIAKPVTPAPATLSPTVSPESEAQTQDGANESVFSNSAVFELRN